MKTLEELTRTIRTVTLESGEKLKQHAFDPGAVEWKSFDDPVTTFDRDIEAYFTKELNKVAPVNVVGEEYGNQDVGSDYTLIIDPIDGTKSFIRGEFNSSIAVALEHKGELVYGAVYDFMKNLLYTADEQGVYGENTTTKENFPLNREVGLKTTTLYLDDKMGKFTPKLENKEHLKTRKAFGSVALNLVNVALGAMDGMISQPYYKSGKTDIAASYFILKQAGLELYDYEGNEFDWRNPSKGLVTFRPEKSYLLDLLFE